MSFRGFNVGKQQSYSESDRVSRNESAMKLMSSSWGSGNDGAWREMRKDGVGKDSTRLHSYIVDQGEVVLALVLSEVDVTLVQTPHFPPSLHLPLSLSSTYTPRPHCLFPPPSPHSLLAKGWNKARSFYKPCLLFNFSPSTPSPPPLLSPPRYLCLPCSLPHHPLN